MVTLRSLGIGPRASETAYVAHDYHDGTEFPPRERGIERAVVGSQQ